MRSVAACLATAFFFCFMQTSSAQNVIKEMVNKHRKSLVYLDISRTNMATGEVTRSGATGFVVNREGHVLTSCHAVNSKPDDSDARADKIVVLGSTATKYSGSPEEMYVIDCDERFDVALLKFRNTAVVRSFVTGFFPGSIEIGTELSVMGFPLDAEFFARPGTLSGLGDRDTYLVAMVLNEGDSGAPVFDGRLNVVGFVDSGYPTRGIGVVRPIRHAAQQLSIAGINLYALNADIKKTLLSSAEVVNPNVYRANPEAAYAAYGSALTGERAKVWSAGNATFGGGKVLGWEFPQIFVPVITGSQDQAVVSDSILTRASKEPKQITVTYPFATFFSEARRLSSDDIIDVHTIPARPGYKVESARVVLTDVQGASVLHVGPTPDGLAARAAVEFGSDVPGADHSYLKGFIETTEIRQ